jgi:hypothetical protein
MAGLQLIGHELAHLAQQKRAGRSGWGALEVVDDPALEAAADCFGAAFADPSLFSAPWLQAADAAAPRGPVQCSGSRGAVSRSARYQMIAEQAAEDEDPDDEDGFPPYGAPEARMEGAQNHGRGVNTAIFVGNVSNAVTQKAITVITNVHHVSNVAGAALAPASAVLGPIGLILAVGESVQSGISAAKTYCHIEKLNLIFAKYQSNPRVDQITLDAVIFTLAKKTKKMKRKLIGTVPIAGGAVNTPYTIGRSLWKRYKGTLGVDRKMHAVNLWNAMRSGDPCALEVCNQLLGVSTFAQIKAYDDGWKVLQTKMKSL